MPRLHRRKRPDAAGNACPKTKYVVHGGGSALMKDQLDARTAMGRAYRMDVKAFEGYLGGDLTLPQRNLVDTAVRLHLLAQIAWGELMRSGLFKEGQPSPAFEVFVKASKDEREILKLLGLQRKAKDLIGNLEEYVEKNYGDTNNPSGD